MINRRIPAFVLMGLAVTACQEQSEDKAMGLPRPVLTVTVHQQQQSDLTFAGVIDSRYRTNLGFRTLGRIDHRFVAVGDRVRQGQVLASLDPATLEQAVRSAQATVSISSAQVEAAALTDERNARLVANKAISTSDAEAARAAHESAEASLVRARADLARAREQLGYASLTTQYDGVVTAVQAEVGQVVAAGTAVMTVARTDMLEAVIDVPTALANEMKPGLELGIRLQIAPEVESKGVVREVSPAADPTTRTRRVRLSLDDTPPGFRIGSTIAAIWNRAVSPYVEIPGTALLNIDGRNRVWVVDPDTKTLASKQVEVARDNGSTVRIASGLASGERIVVAGVNSLQEGEVVALPTENSN